MSEMTTKKIGAKKKIGMYLIGKGLLTHEQLSIALKEQTITSGLIGDIIIRFGFCKREDVIQSMIEHCPDDLIGNSVTNISLPQRFLEETKSIDKGNTGEIFYIATLHKNPQWVRNEAEKYLNKLYPHDKQLKVKLVPCNKNEIDGFLAKCRINTSPETLIDVEEEDDVNKILDALINDAMEKRASDIHIIQTEETIHVKMRIDNVMHVSHILSKEAANKLFPRIKGKTFMDITQTRTTQDGSFSQIYKGRVIDFRVAIKPIKDGEKITIRILDKERICKSIDEIGLSKIVLEPWKELTRKREGLILVCGTTGSGKTTTLYSTIQHMDYIHKNICTIEDPIEYTLPFIVQTQVNRLVQPPIDFNGYVRAVLRHDPDIVIVGELRDAETVKACMDLAVSGHLVYGTLHTNDVPTTFGRLEKMGVDMGQLAYCLRAILVQKLTRVLCPKCNGATCDYCNKTGYYGQVPVAEFTTIDNAEDFKSVLENKKKYLTFDEDAVIKAQTGITDCKELSRILGKKVEYCTPNGCLRGGRSCM